MTALAAGGGSSAVAASAHAGCQRFRHTDPLVTGQSRRALAAVLGAPDTSGRIPEARWARAMQFERLVRDPAFVSRLITTTVGALGLDRPVGVRRVECGNTPDGTAAELARAHLKAVHEGVATMLTGLAVPFPGLESEPAATSVKPDFAVVAQRPAAPGSGQSAGSWLVMGDAKDYERVRARIDDARMLKGFLQVALGAQAAQGWSRLPTGMRVHDSGALAVPRTAFLSPEAVVERLDDHRREVAARVDERTALLAARSTGDASPDLGSLVAHLEAHFDPQSCPSCSLFHYCRNQIRTSGHPEDLLVEIGVRPGERRSLLGLFGASVSLDHAPVATLAQVRATLAGIPAPTGARRTDPIGEPGTVEVVIAKSDGAALGVYGVALRHVGRTGIPTPWATTVFPDAQAVATRRAVMSLLGTRLTQAQTAVTDSSAEEVGPIHLVVPDTTTGDVLVSIADSLAGVETQRIRWARDLAMGRHPLTFDGEPAQVPEPLTDTERLAVSFLLEDDRARTMRLRCALVDARAVLVAHLLPGGSVAERGRLDYLVRWAESGATSPLEQRLVTDEIEASEHTPGARLSQSRSDAIHAASRGVGRGGSSYTRLVKEELSYKTDVLTRAVTYLTTLPVSQLRQAYRAIEGQAQAVWRRRLELHASDLVRFSRTHRRWRNDQVGLIEADASCADQLAAFTNPQYAAQLARDAGTREVALAEVLAVNPVVLKVDSRRLGVGSRIVLLHRGDRAVVEQPEVEVKVQGGAIKLRQQHVGLLVDSPEAAALGGLEWQPKRPVRLAVGEQLIVANGSWFARADFTSGHEVLIARPALDTASAPKTTCTATSFEEDPEEHQWCCQSHEDAEAAWSDELAARRERGELNPQTWPPLVDEDRFDVRAASDPDPASGPPPVVPVPDHLTLDDVD